MYGEPDGGSASFLSSIVRAFDELDRLQAVDEPVS
jgi:hypothetical protein